MTPGDQGSADASANAPALSQNAAHPASACSATQMAPGGGGVTAGEAR